MENLYKSGIDLIVDDFDGVMTDNRVFFFQDGTEAAEVNRADGFGINMIKGFGIPQMILSAETNSIDLARAEKAGSDDIQGVNNKREELVNPENSVRRRKARIFSG